MAKGYSKGGVKKFNEGRIVKKLTPTTIKTPTPSKTKNLSQMLRPTQFSQFTKMLNKSRQNGGKFTVADVKFAYNSMMGDKKMSTKDPMTRKPVPKSRLTKEGKKLVKQKK